MKKNNKILTTLALVALLVGAFGVSAFGADKIAMAENNEVALTEATAEIIIENATEGGVSHTAITQATEDGASNTATNGASEATASIANDGETEGADDIANEAANGETEGGKSTPAAGENASPEADGGENNATEGNIFDELFALVSGYSGEIFSLLSLAASLILAYLYKCGLMPLVKSTLSGLSGAVSAIRESTEEAQERGGSITAALTERLESAEAIIAKISEGIDNMSADLAEREAEAGERAELKTVLAAQIDMLYEIFMTSNLPEYKKAAVGEKIAEMRRSIGANDGSTT